MYEEQQIEGFCRAETTEVRMTEVQVTHEDIMKSIKELRNSSSPGPDGVPVILLKNCIDELSVPLQNLWAKSLQTGDIPQPLKSGLVVPIFKKGGRHLAENYRPVSTTSHIISL